MMHTRRNWAIADVTELDVLRKKLLEHSWTICTGFRMGNIVFLNDSTGECGAQEFGVFRDGAQVDSWTVSWMTPESFDRAWDELASATGNYANLDELKTSDARDHGTCRGCA